MSTTWLDILLSGNGLEEIRNYRNDLVADGLSAEKADQQAATALRLHALLDQRRRRTAELTALNNIAAQLASTHTADELLEQITAQARQLLGVDLAYIGLIRGRDFVIEVATGALTSRLVGFRACRTNGMFGAVLNSGQPLWTSNYTGETAFAD